MILLVLLIVFIGIQFIRPVRNESEQVLSADITKTFNVPDSVLNVLKISCYDFSDFGAYSRRRQISKLRSIISQIQDDKMPLSSYTTIHKDAVLTTEDKTLIIDWSNKTKDSLSLLN